MKQLSSLTSGEASTLRGVGLGRVSGGGMPGLSIADPAVLGRHGDGGPDFAPNGRNVGIGGLDGTRTGHETKPLPPDASSTLYVEGLPPDSTRREVARILSCDTAWKSHLSVFLLPTLLIINLDCF